MGITKKSARVKGKTLERDVAKALSDIGIDAKRVPMSGALSWLKGDVVEFNTAPKHLHECKNQQALSLGTWWQQAEEQCIAGEIPVLHFTSNYKPVYTMITNEVFDSLVFAYEEKHKELPLNLRDLPRKNFWTFSQGCDRFDIFLLEDRVILLFDLYLRLRVASLKLGSVDI